MTARSGQSRGEPKMTPTGQSHRLGCPNCRSAEHLGENVSGWRECDPPSLVDGQIVAGRARLRRDVFDAERTSWFCSNQGCDVSTPIADDELVQVDE